MPDKRNIFFPKLFHQLIFITFFIGIFFFFLHPVNGDGDIFHHLQAGKHIIEHKQLPKIDEYTFTARGKPWIANAWGTDIIYYILYNSFGPNSISIFVALQAVIVFVLLYLYLREYRIKRKYILLSLSFAAAVLSTRWPNRPELITYPFIVLILLIDKLKLRFPKIPLVYPVLILLWSILYGGSVFIGLLLLSTICIKQFLADKYKVTQKTFLLYIATFVSYAVSFLNGYGYKTIFYIFSIPEATKNQGEWRGIFDNLFNMASTQLLINHYRIAIFLLFIITFLFLIIIQRKQIKKNTFISFLSLSLLTPFFAIRNIPLATILALPLFAVLIYNLTKSKYSRIYFYCILFICVVSFAIAGWSNSHGIGRDEKAFPSKLVQFLDNNKLYGNVFADQQTCPRLTYELYPKVLVYADTRDELFAESSVLSDFVDLQKGDKNILTLLDKYKAAIVVADITYGKMYEPLLYSSKWALVYASDRYFIFTDTQVAKQKNLRQFVAIDPFAANGVKLGKEQQGILEYKYILSQNPNSLNIHFLLSQVLLSQKNYQDAIPIAEEMQIPSGVGALLFNDKKNFILATSYLGLGNCSYAKRYIDNYHNDLSNKFIFLPFKKLTGVDEELYMIYYLTCERNPIKGQEHLVKFINDSEISINLKQYAVNLYKQLINADLNTFRQ